MLRWWVSFDCLPRKRWCVMVSLMLCWQDVSQQGWELVAVGDVGRRPVRGRGRQGWPLATVQKYLFHMRRALEPRMRPDAERLLLAYYQWQRRAAERSSARTTIRMLESLLRLSQVPPVVHLAYLLTDLLVACAAQSAKRRDK